MSRQSQEGSSAEIIESIEDLENLCGWLSGVKRISLDIEADSFYTYHPKICLLQLSTDDYDFIIDPLAVKDMSPLGPILRNPSVEKVFHAGEYDLQCLKRDYGFQIVHIFDTMIAARMLGMKQLGLAALILNYFNVTLIKKYQRADWGKRPLTQGQIDYAQMDTHYLLRLRDILHAELTAKDRLEDALESFERLSQIEPPERIFDPHRFWQLTGARSLTPQGRAVLKNLYFFREKKAAELDKAPFRVLPETLLVRLAEKSPLSASDLGSVDGMTPFLSQRFGVELLSVIQEGLQSPEIESPPKRAKPSEAEFRRLEKYQALRQWRKKKAEERGLDPVAILHTDDLHKIAQASEEGLDETGWAKDLSETKRKLYGDEIISILKAFIPAPPHAKHRKRSRRGRSGSH